MQQLDVKDLLLLQALADGETIASVAPRFKMKPGSLKMRLHRLRDQLGADTSIQAVAMALRRKLIE